MTQSIDIRNQKKLQELKALILRKEQLEDRKNLLQLSKIRAELLNEEINNSEASITELKILGAMANRMIERSKFKNYFCRKIRNIQDNLDNIEYFYAKVVFETIMTLYSFWEIDPYTLNSVSSLSAKSIINQRIDTYCQSS